MKVHVILMVVLVLAMLGVPVSAADSAEPLNASGALYSQSVDLANEGKYQQALGVQAEGGLSWRGDAENVDPAK